MATRPGAPAIREYGPACHGRAFLFSETQAQWVWPPSASPISRRGRRDLDLPGGQLHLKEIAARSERVFTGKLTVGLTFGILFLAYTAQLSARRGEQIRQPDHQHDVTENKSQPTRPLPFASPEQPKATSNAQQTKDRANRTWRDFLSEAFAPATLPNWLLGIIGGVAAGIALYTLKAIRHQAEIARDSLSEMKAYVGLTNRLAESNREAAEAAARSAGTAAESARLAERALHLTERADILLEAVPISTYPVLDGSSVVSIVFKNFGRTRGNRAEIKATLSFEGLEPASDEAPPLVAQVIAPGDTQRAAFRPMREWLTKDTFTRIRSGAVAMRFQADAVYFDIFGNRHHSRYSGVFMPEACCFRIDRDQEAD